MTNYRYACILVLIVMGIGSLKAQNGQFGISNGVPAPAYQSNTLNTGNDDSFSIQQPDLFEKESSLEVFQRNQIAEKNWIGNNNRWNRRSRHYVNFHIGLTNFLEDGDIPDSDALYSVKPLSWYAAVNFDNTTKVVGPLFMNWGAGVSMQDFSFENTRARLVKGDDSITFTEDMDVTGKKSKLNVMHLNVHFIPTFNFGRYDDFRIGVGVYAGYRINSFAKYKYKDADGERQKDKIKDNLFISPFKYGFRGVIGWDSFDLFFNYDVTELFEDDKTAPRLNPVTFGIIF